MKVGYQDAGSWTILKDSVTGEDRAMAWLWAQFCISKTVDLKKFLVGNTPIRKSTIFSDYLAEHADYYGGLIEFYRSPEEKKWTDSGPNVPHYPMLAEQWWKNIAPAVTGAVTPQEAMDKIAYTMDDIMSKLRLKKFRPVLNEKKDREYWLNQPGAPKPERPDQAPRTMPYDDMLQQWKSQ